MIIVVTHYDKEIKKEIVSHGVDTNTCESIVLESSPIDDYFKQGLVYLNNEIDEYVLREDKK